VTVKEGDRDKEFNLRELDKENDFDKSKGANIGGL
jgi:hypothetical protein